MNSSKTEKSGLVRVRPKRSRVDPTTEIVPAPSQSLVAAAQVAEGYRKHVKSRSTRRGYEVDWRRFLQWGATHGAPTLPAPPEVICMHLAWLADEGYSVATIRHFLSAGSHYHHAEGVDFPRNAFIVHETLRGIRKRIGAKVVKAAPLGLKALSDACERLRREATGAGERAELIALRYCAMLTVGWFCMLRSANLVAIQREHIRLVRVEDEDWNDSYENPNGLIVHLPSSKTDQLREGRDVATHAQTEEKICPVRALREYLLVAQLAPSDLVFPVNGRTVSRLIKRLASNESHGHKSLREIGLCDSCSAASRRFASHSLRRGAATTYAKEGMSERDIMRQGGWVNERVARGYMDHATLFQNNPTGSR